MTFDEKRVNVNVCTTFVGGVGAERRLLNSYLHIFRYSCSLWLRYGTLIDDLFVVSVNIFGTILQICYILVYILYSVKRSTTIKQFAAATFFVALVYLYSIYQEDRVLAAKHVGFLSCSLTILFFASPLILLVNIKKPYCLCWNLIKIYHDDKTVYCDFLCFI